MQDNAWLLTAEDGGWGPAYRWDGMTAMPVPDADAQVRALYVLDDRVWLEEAGRDRSTTLWRMQNGSWESIRLDAAVVEEMVSAAGSVWVSTAEGVYRLTGTKAVRMPDRELHAHRILEHDGAVWLLAGQGAFRIVGDDVIHFPTGGHTPRDLVIANGVVWLLTGQLWQPGPGFRLEGDTAVPFRDGDVNVVSVQEKNGKTTITLQRKSSFAYETIEISE